MAAISDDIQRFVHQCIDSVEGLEVLCLLHATPSQRWTAPKIDEKVRSDLRSIENRLRSLVRHGLVKVMVLEGNTTFYQYAPANETLGDLVDELSRLYQQRRIAVINLIFQRPPVADPVTSFADAFLLKRPDDKENTDG